MKIILNGAPCEVRAARLSDILEELDQTGAHIATAVNESFVATADRADTVLAEGDRLEIVAPMQGG